MLELNLSLQTNLVQMLMGPSGSTPSPAAATGAAAPGSGAVQTDGVQTSPSGFEQLLQILSQPPDPSVKSALPELTAVVASLTSLAASSNLLEGVERPPGSAEIPTTPDEKKPASIPQSPAELDLMASLQAMLALAPQIIAPQILQKVTTPLNSEEPATTPGQQPQPGIVLGPSEQPHPEIATETPRTAAQLRPLLNLQDFDVRRFEFTTEVEVAAVQPRLIRIEPVQRLMQAQARSQLTQATQPKPVKGSVEVIDTPATAPTLLEGRHEAPLIQTAQPVQRVQVAIDPPPPPPVARQISMDVGDPESQVRVVIRERNGDLAVQFGAATERLRENLQNAAPLLMHELQRENTHQSISLDFSRFGTATESGRDSHQQESPRKKFLKSEAVFADVDETAYLIEDSPSAKPF